MVICRTPTGRYVLGSGDIMRTLVQVADIANQHLYRHWGWSESMFVQLPHHDQLESSACPKGRLVHIFHESSPLSMRRWCQHQRETGIYPLCFGPYSVRSNGASFWLNGMMFNMFDLIRLSVWCTSVGLCTCSSRRRVKNMPTLGMGTKSMIVFGVPV